MALEPQQLLEMYQKMVTIRRLSNGAGCQISLFIQQIPSVRHQYGGRIFSALALSST